ncbi:hypothetical protein L6452_04490 [Arctium lappa]|uniref:Uncharacterized protein n=1 Tax=Arctium lappa TaxID=4217 RepID=A0ACB9EEH0_ARCLA|nr:hypothetical protein L6452_04490 [Arctium lappa]
MGNKDLMRVCEENFVNSAIRAKFEAITNNTESNAKVGDEKEDEMGSSQNERAGSYSRINNTQCPPMASTCFVVIKSSSIEGRQSSVANSSLYRL